MTIRCLIACEKSSVKRTIISKNINIELCVNSYNKFIYDFYIMLDVVKTYYFSCSVILFYDSFKIT